MRTPAQTPSVGSLLRMLISGLVAARPAFATGRPLHPLPAPSFTVASLAEGLSFSDSAALRRPARLVGRPVTSDSERRSSKTRG